MKEMFEQVIAMKNYDLKTLLANIDQYHIEGRLTDEEYEISKTHTVHGGRIIRETFGKTGNEPYCRVAESVALRHHEKWGGGGYPDGLKGTDIPLCARIMAVAVVFDAEAEISRAEAGVMLDRLLSLTNVSCENSGWAAQSAANLDACGIMDSENVDSAALTHAEAADMLAAAMNVLGRR